MSNLNTKLTTLAHLKSAMESSKGYIDQQDAVLSGQIAGAISDIETLDAAALRGLKVNGNLLNVTDKIAELLIESGTENGTINANGGSVSTAVMRSTAAFRSGMSKTRSLSVMRDTRDTPAKCSRRSAASSAASSMPACASTSVRLLYE